MIFATTGFAGEINNSQNEVIYQETAHEYTVTNLANIGAQRSLDYRQRTVEIQEKIDQTFDELREAEERYDAQKDIIKFAEIFGNPNWMIYGGQQYNLCSIDDEKFVLHIIQQSSTEKSEFYFLDVGAGNYSWIENIAKLLNNDPLVPKDKKYHLIGLNAEGRDEVINVGNCKIYKLGGFKIENVIEEFEKRGMFLNGKIDLTVSKMTMVHLIDRLGIFMQIEKLTKTDGFIMLDGLYFLTVNPDGSIN